MLLPAMYQRMTREAESNQVWFGIITAPAAKILVMNLKVRASPARLTSPTVAAQHLFAESFVQLEIEPQAWLFGENPIHEAFSATSCRKAWR
jgi:hypothetical protein